MYKHDSTLKDQNNVYVNNLVKYLKSKDFNPDTIQPADIYRLAIANPDMFSIDESKDLEPKKKVA